MNRLSLVGIALGMMMPSTVFAGSATWKSTPSTNDWNTAANWSPATVPNGAADVATFATSNITTVSMSAETTVDAIVFDAAASAFTIKAPSLLVGLGFSFNGAGVVNNSGKMQTFDVIPTGLVDFANSSTAGSNMMYLIEPAAKKVDFGQFAFFDSSSAGDATFFFPGAAPGKTAGFGDFLNDSTAANATFILDDGRVRFLQKANAGQSHFTINGGKSTKIREATCISWIMRALAMRPWLRTEARPEIMAPGFFSWRMPRDYARVWKYLVAPGWISVPLHPLNSPRA